MTNRNWRAYVLFVTFGATLMLLACGSSDNQGTSVGKSELHAAVSRPSDGSITAWVHEAFELDPRMSPSKIKIDTVDGIVTLEGSVSNLLQKRYARLEAGKISGVRGVIDKLAVNSPVRSDEDIQHDIALRLSHSSYGHFRDVDVLVAGGDVTLSGLLPTWAQRDEAETLASEVRGVRSVVNNLTVDAARTLSDDERRDAIVAELNRDAYLTGLPITVLVEDGFATLEGTVGNAYEKERAETDAYLATSLNQVNNNLFVDWLEERGVREKTPLPNDSHLLKAVREELTLDLRLADPSMIEVQVVGGHVTLTGSVTNFYEHQIAEEDARNVVGVGEVTDLIYAIDEHLADETIESSIMSAMDTDYALHGRDLGVDVDGGEVTLTGQVDSFFQRRHAAEVASRIFGVRDVINQIDVNSRPGYTDAALRERLSRYLESNWKTRPVADRIQLEVEDGKVVLSGTVDDWAERMEAERLVRNTEGVLNVKDELLIE